jgi:tubulin monoglycylase TTLL3/8
VLVSDWNPLNIWFDEDCYLRFCVEEFGLDDLDDKFVHLANNSISKNSKNFSKTYTTEDGAEHEVEGNMWHSDDFIAHLQRTQGSAAVWHEWVVPQMKRIVRSSMMCVQDAVENRKNSCELFGYDFMIDEHYNPWLIEVNSSPACDYSTPTAEKIVKKGLADALKVVIDHREWSQKVRQPLPLLLLLLLLLFNLLPHADALSPPPYTPTVPCCEEEDAGAGHGMLDDDP